MSDSSIHPTAVVHSAARLGTGVQVGPGAVIEADVEIGADSHIGPHAVVLSGTRMGARCRVHSGAVLGDAPQDLAYQGAPSWVEIGDECVFREGVTVHRGTKEGSITRVGHRCFLMANSHVAHNCVLADEVILANGVLLGGYVEVGARAFISGNAVVHQFCRVGRLAMLSGLSAASKDVPPFCILENSTSNTIAGLNVVGMRRAGFSPDQRAEIKRAFRMLYRSGLNVDQAVEQMKSAFPAGPAAELWQFAESAKRGICAIDTSSLQSEP
jgi:UDP-N-acetylglucosamine acyltransferase